MPGKRRGECPFQPDLPAVKSPRPPSLVPLEPSTPAAPPSGLAALDVKAGRDEALVWDAICALQAPSGTTRISELLGAAGLRTERGAAFHSPDVKRVTDRLLEAGHVVRDVQGRLVAAAPHGMQRFLEMMREPARGKAWFDAWAKVFSFHHGYSLAFQEEVQLVAALRLVIYGGGSLAHLGRLQDLNYSRSYMWFGAVRQAVLEPFDAALFGALEPKLASHLAEQLMLVISGVAELASKPFEDWLIARCAALPIGRHAALVSPTLRCRMAETQLFRGEFAAARALCTTLTGAGVRLLEAAVDIAEGQWAAGARAFEAAQKLMSAETGRRKNLSSPSLACLYLMALLAEPAPESWTKARKFAASEGGKQDPFGLFKPWQDAVDQRLGDAPREPGRFRLARRVGSGAQSLQDLQHLLLAAWLRVPVAAPAPLREHVQRLSADFERAGFAWAARQARRAQAALLGEPASPSDAAAPFFVGEVQDSWREALASILALGANPAGPARAREGSVQDRLVWVVKTRTDGRIVRLEPLEQKAGVRGLGKPKPVTLATLAKRKNLATHDAAVLRAVRRTAFGNRLLLDIASAAPALVRHPSVAWDSDPTQFIEVVEALPALEVMTKDEHIVFALLDPLQAVEQGGAEADADADENYDLDLNDDDDGEFEVRETLQTLRRRLLRAAPAGLEQRPPEHLLLLPDGPSRARLLRLTPAQLRVGALVSQGWKVPLAARAELDAALRVLSTHFQVASDAEAGHEVDASSLLHAELTPQGGGLALRVVAAPFGDFGPRLAPGGGRERVTTVHEGVTLSTRRDLAAESAAMHALHAAADFLDDGTHEWLLDDPQEALAVVEALSGLGTGIVSEWPKGKPMRVRAVPDAAVKLRATSTKGDWLELEGELQLDDGEVLRLQRLLELAQSSRSRFVALGNGDFLALGDALRQQLTDLAALAQPHKQGQRLGGVAALAWAASGNSLVLEGDTAWNKRSQAWALAQERQFDAPAGLVADLRDYQLEGYRWLMRLGSSGFGAVLADDMGLGKTVQTLAMLLQRAAGGAALVVAPTSVCGNWLAEVARFAPGLQVELYGDVAGDDADDTGEGIEDELADTPAATETATDSEAQTAAANAPDNARRAARRRQVRALGPGSLLVCSYALLQIDADVLTATAWHSVVLDEAQAIKNPATRRAEAALALQGDFRLALTGTPIENRLGELWSIMSFCNPGLLGSAEQFAKRFANAIERADDPQLKAQAARRLRRLLAPFLLRRTKAEVLADLPPRTEIVHEVVPGPRERALLEALRREAEASVSKAVAANTGASREGQNQFHVLAALTRLRRAACDPRLVAPELGIVGAKVQEFERLAVELVAGRHKALVFSQFTDFLALLRERLDAAGLAYQYLDGSTPAAERSKRVAAFQAGQGDLFLISLKAGGFGLNLTVADYVIIADPWWNPATEEQASARAHRIGQARPVTVYRLVTQGSIEEKIVRLHRSKRDLAEGILSGQDVGAAPLDAGQLMDLLKES